MPVSVEVFKIRRNIRIALGVCSGGMLCLLILALIQDSSSAELMVIAGIVFVTMVFLISAWDRRITFTDQAVIFRKFFRTKEVPRGQILHVGGFAMRARRYLLLTTTNGFFIVSNAYDNFPALIRNIVEHAGPDKVEEEIRNLAETSADKGAAMISLWIAAAVICLILIARLLSV